MALRCLGQRDGLISSVWRSYTKTDLSTDPIGDPRVVADHVRCVGYRAAPTRPESDLDLCGEVDGVPRLAARQVEDHFFRLTVRARDD
jgi:hypothetical protein